MDLYEKSNVILKRSRKPTKEFTLHERVSQHPNVVTLYRTIDEHEHACAVLEICEGNIGTAIAEDVFYRNDELVRSVFLQILSAVQYCHERGVFHRDLRPENIMCSSDRTSVRLANFGLSTHEKRSLKMGGNPYYMSPECVNSPGGDLTINASYSTGYNDLWALGIILINLITGCYPWSSASSK
ncbi:kinase-like protein, partial [Marasmius fiardii PR-910]